MMGGNFIPETARRLRNRTYLLLASAVAFGLGACGQSAPGAEAAEAEEMEFLEFAAAPEELAVTPVNDIVKSLRMNATAMRLGERVYNTNCAGCHGADMKGTREQHAPDLTDANWLSNTIIHIRPFRVLKHASAAIRRIKAFLVGQWRQLLLTHLQLIGVPGDVTAGKCGRKCRHWYWRRGRQRRGGSSAARQGNT